MSLKTFLLRTAVVLAVIAITVAITQYIGAKWPQYALLAWGLPGAALLGLVAFVRPPTASKKNKSDRQMVRCPKCEKSTEHVADYITSAEAHGVRCLKCGTVHREV